MPPFEVHAPFEPAGDQPAAIAALTAGLVGGQKFQTLLGVTGSGKTLTLAHVIANYGKPTLVLSHNKTLAAQLYGELKHRHHRESGNSDQLPVGEPPIGLDLGERHRADHPFDRNQLDHHHLRIRLFWIGIGGLGDPGDAHDPLLGAGVIDETLIPRRHCPEIAERHRVGHAIPDARPVPLEIVVTVGGRLSLE